MLQQREADRVKVVDTDMKQLALQTRSDIPANQKKMNKGKSNSKHADPCNARHIAEPNPPKYTESQSQVPPGTTQDHLDPHDKRHIWQKFVESGPFSWMWDGFKSFNWDLFTHPCFLTYGHQDAAGFATTVAARTGCKIWCILRPKIDGINTRRLQTVRHPQGYTTTAPFPRLSKSVRCIHLIFNGGRCLVSLRLHFEIYV